MNDELSSLQERQVDPRLTRPSGADSDSPIEKKRALGQPPTDLQSVAPPEGIGESRPADSQGPEPKPPGAYADLEAMRLPAKFATTLGVKKLPGKVTVGKPKDQFFRIRRGDEWTYRGYTIKYQQETYLVDPRIVHLIPPNLIRAVEIFVGVDRNNQVFLLPVGLPGGRAPESLARESGFGSRASLRPMDPSHREHVDRRLRHLSGARQAF